MSGKPETRRARWAWNSETILWLRKACLGLSREDFGQLFDPPYPSRTISRWEDHQDGCMPQDRALQQLGTMSEKLGFNPVIRTIELSLLSAIGDRDFTKEHSQETGEILASFTKRLGVMRHDRLLLREAALLHDIDRVTWPERAVAVRDIEILRTGQKPEYGSHSEFHNLVTQHPVAAANMARRTSSEAISQIIRNHHERVDGSGFPTGVKKIDPLVRMFAVVDVYDTLLRQLLEHKETAEDKDFQVKVLVQELSKPGYDQKIVHVFWDYVGIDPSKIS